jgi:hypothetical protein
MVGLHWRGRFIELVPWAGEVQVRACARMCAAPLLPRLAQAAARPAAGPGTRPVDQCIEPYHAACCNELS